TYPGGVVALDGVDLVVPTGDLVAVLGPSGCGKSTLLRVIAGFERPDRGTVCVGGRTVAGPATCMAPERRRVGIVPQEQALFPHLSVAANVAYGLPRGPGRDGRVDDMLRLAGLSGLGSRMPHELSGGQQQRVALARALAPAPSVVLLDEPFANLDAALRATLRAEVRDILRAAGTTTLIVTHDQEEALSLADTVAVMRGGRIVQAGPPDEVYRRPADVWVAEFVGDANVIDGTATSAGKVSCALGVLASASEVGDGPVQVVVRPEQVRLGPSGPLSGQLGPSGPLSGQPLGPTAAVVDRQYFGHDVLVRVVLADGTPVVARTSSAEGARPGSEVSVACEGEVLAFPVPGPERPPERGVGPEQPSERNSG
ncbi:MAG: ABC transporter ATP-binding protein, partial [Actinomycetota bacterium]|nr:ABC transporter ATP-binding protein [Actinomycetota bacterium]